MLVPVEIKRLTTWNRKVCLAIVFSFFIYHYLYFVCFYLEAYRARIQSERVTGAIRWGIWRTGYRRRQGRSGGRPPLTMQWNFRVPWGEIFAELR